MWPSTTEGRPALGMHEMGMRACWLRWRRCSLISTGPVAQLMPMTSGRMASSAQSAALISVPGSMRPVSSMVTCTWSGTSRPAAAMARRQAIMAALIDSRSNMVSMMRTSTPPSRSPAAWISKLSRSSAKRI